MTAWQHAAAGHARQSRNFSSRSRSRARHALPTRPIHSRGKVEMNLQRCDGVGTPWVANVPDVPDYVDPFFMTNPPHRVQAQVLSQTFYIDPAYKIVRGLGQGAYGCVASAVHVASGESIAIKKVSNVFTKRILTKRALRELKYVAVFTGC